MKVAIATQDLKQANAHFASARSFALYEVSAAGHRFLEAVQFDLCSGEDGVHAEEGTDRIAPRLEAITGCALLFVTGIGGPAAARVVNQRIHPIKLATPESIPDLLTRLQHSLNGNPPPWLRKIIQADAAPIQDFMADD
jgi:nitrogen fixation protein NifX